MLNITGKRLFLFFLMGGMIVILLFTPGCFILCAAVHNATDVSHGTSCTMLSHAFVQTGTGVSAIFILSLMGLLLLRNSYFIPAGFFLSPFKPPRFHALTAAVDFN